VADTTIRGMIRDIQTEVRDTKDLSPDRASDLLVQLTALYGNVLDEVRQADAAYSAVLLAKLNGDEAAARAKIRAQVSPEYQRAREAKDTEKLSLELIRSLKSFIRLKQEEMKL
jgi:hypothetical protein